MQLALLALLMTLVLEVIREVAGESKVGMAQKQEKRSTSTDALQPSLKSAAVGAKPEAETTGATGGSG